MKSRRRAAHRLNGVIDGSHIILGERRVLCLWSVDLGRCHGMLLAATGQIVPHLAEDSGQGGHPVSYTMPQPAASTTEIPNIQDSMDL